MNFYDNLKKICAERGLKVTPTVLESGGTKGVISGWKNGSYPNSDIVMNLSVLLNVPTDVLLFGKEKSSAPELTEEEQKCLEAFKQLRYEDRIAFIARMEQKAEDYTPEAKENVS